MKEAYTPNTYVTDQLFEACLDAISGKPFFEKVVLLPQTDARFTYGAEKGEDGILDLNYANILVTVRVDGYGNAEVLSKYEVYDSNGGYVETRRYIKSFLDFCGRLMEGDDYSKYRLMGSAREWVDDNDDYVVRTIRLHNGLMVDYNDASMRIVDGTDRALLIRDRGDFSDVKLIDALTYAKDAYAEYVRFMSDDGRRKGIEIKFSEDGLRDALPESRPKRDESPQDMGWPYRMVYAVPVTKTYSVEFVSLEKAEEFRDKFAWAFKDFHNDIFDIG